MSWLRSCFHCALLLSVFAGGRAPAANVSVKQTATTPSLQKRWLFVWRNMSDAKEVERMIERFPRAAAAGYNGVVFSHNIVPEKAGELKEAAKRNGLDLIAIVMGGA